jgi:outer membrane biosynthesis protein TonB
MGLGALVLVLVIVAAGFYLPKFKKASASGEAQPKSEVTAPMTQPKTEPVPVPAQTQATTTEQSPASVPPAVAPAKATKPVREPEKKQLTSAAAVPVTPSAPAVDTAALNEVENEVDQLTSRAASVDTGLANLQRQQAAAGYGLRGDMAEKQAAMRLNIAKAQDAVRNKDVERAKKYASVASMNIEALEKFLGR